MELSDVDVQGTVESERGSQRGNDLGDEPVQVSVSGSLDVEVSSADVIHSFVIKHNSHVSVLQEGVSGENGVVRFNDGS